MIDNVPTLTYPHVKMENLSLTLSNPEVEVCKSQGLWGFACHSHLIQSHSEIWSP